MSEFLELLHNPAHWGFEAVSDAVFAVPAYLVGRWRVRAHDKKVHNK